MLPRLAAALLLAAAPAAAAEPTLDAIDAEAKAMLGDGAPGLAVLVMREGEVVHMRGYGLADIDTGTPVDEHTVFDLASLSKQMTGLAAMLLVEEGALAENMPVSALLPDFAGSETGERAITVGDLVHHLSGLPDYLSGDTEGLRYGARTTNAQIVRWLADQPLDAPPGTVFSYSNSGYLALGSAVAAADEAESLAEVLAARVFEPLGMEETALVEPVEGAVRATGYKGTAGAFEPSREASVTEGDGNVLTTIADLALYEAALHEGTLLSPEASERLFSDGAFDDGSALVQEEGDADGYGFGWNLAPAEAPRYAFHSGSWMGTSTYYQRNLETGVSVVVLANGEDFEAGTLAEAVEAALED